VLPREHGIGAVVDLRSEARDDEDALRAAGVDFLHLPTDDHCAVADDDLARGVAFVRSRIADGRRVLVHCQYGIGRSPLLALCVLTAEGVRPMTALELAKSRREVCSPSPAQHGAWVRWLSRHKAEHGAAWDPPDFDSFKAVAYRRLVSR
jgi:protein-tyrosine phosphatase